MTQAVDRKSLKALTASVRKLTTQLEKTDRPSEMLTLARQIEEASEHIHVIVVSGAVTLPVITLEATVTVEDSNSPETPPVPPPSRGAPGTLPLRERRPRTERRGSSPNS